MLDLEQIWVCRENKLPLDPAVVASAVDAVDYISSENLKPVSDPVVKFKSNGRTGVKGLAKDLRFVERCESKDWLKICVRIGHSKMGVLSEAVAGNASL
ncbi:hypothetical protein HanXRQr2_Chr02g0061041 [Helianthus annuus]|uniref:Uncharacterized protein n=1 Tax=Helianthus annuus TaxID=4232 RepID=A0A251VDJ1_HELAN|nr:hypothetical protein HanXRQr2_Chr02g0061041 [Helianthus annuus]